MTHTPALQAVVLDIEGTTTSIRFVYDAMFPFARREVAAFLRDRWDDPDVAADVALLSAQAEADIAEGLDGAVAIPAPGEASAEARRDAALKSVLWQMDHDRKTTGLKSLQGKIWKAGFESGELRGHVFDEVPGVMEALRERGVALYIYSSGSISAQKLLFGHSAAGDLTTHLSGYFDTTTGPKKVADSYRAICASIGAPPASVAFVTDHPQEAAAAREAGLRVWVCVRPGNAPLPEDHDFDLISTLTPLLQEAPDGP